MFAATRGRAGSRQSRWKYPHPIHVPHPPSLVSRVRTTNLRRSECVTATRSELRGCLVCKAARDAARRAALKRDPLCPVARKAAQQWTEEDENPPRATMAHLLSGACLGNREQARWFLRVARAQTGTAISKVAQAAPDSKDTLKTLRMAHVAALKGSRYRVLDEDGYDALAPAVGGVLPALVDDLSEKSRRDLGAGVTRNLQVVAEAATGAVQRGIQLNDEATARIMKREENIEWLRKLFAGWKEARPALRESRRRRDNGGNVQTGQQPVGRTRAATAAQAGGSGDGGALVRAASEVGETDDAPST